MNAAGYSGTPLARKLGITAGARVYTLGAPAAYREWLAPMPPGVTFARRVDATTNVAHVFAKGRAELRAALADCRKQMAPDAAVWVSWPKKSAGIASEVSEDTVRELALPLGFVDIKVCAVSEVWSGLKLVVRKALR